MCLAVKDPSEENERLKHAMQDIFSSAAVSRQPHGAELEAQGKMI